MPDTYEVVFVDKIVGNDRRVLVEFKNLESPNINKIIILGRDKICRYLDCERSDLVFRSLRVI